MKIGVAIEKFDPATGGAERYCWDLAHYLSRKGHEVHVFCLKARNPQDPSIHILELKAIRVPQALRHLSFALQHYLKAKTMKDALHFCVGNTFYMDIYQPHGGIHRAWFVKETQRFSERARPLMRFLKRLSVKDLVQRTLEWWTLTQTRPRVIAISQMVCDDLKNYFQYPKALIDLIPNGIDTMKFSPKNRRHREEVRHRYGIEKDEFVFLFVAQNLSLKGFDILVQACVIQKNLSFRVLIIGPSSRAHRRKARELEERVVFGGRASDLEKIYPACDCLVHPSYYDACSLVVLEALASGIPVITTISNGAGMFVRPEYGEIIRSGDSRALAGSMKTMMESGGRKIRELPFDSDHEVFEKIETVIRGHGL